MEEKGKQAAREEQGRKPWTLREFGGKTLWDWLDLLLVPLVLGIVAAGLTAWFNAQQEARQNDIEEQRARAERELAEQRAEDEVLQTYLDQMGTLLIEKDLRGSKEGSEVRTLARARTLTATGRLSAGRKRVLIRFLYEANLIDRTHPIIALDGANLQDINLRGVNLSGGPFLLETHLGRDGRIPIGGPKSKLSIGSDGVDLSGADISRAKLANAVLIGADLSGVRLSYANLRHALIGSTNSRSTDLTGAFLENADLTGASLDNTDLSGAILVRSHLRNSYLTESILRDTNFSGTDLSNAYLLGTDLSNANLSDADLKGADLTGANLTGADLSNANLSSYATVLIGADLSDADLSGTNLREADLEGAEGVSEERLEEQAKTLEDATMPDGSIHD